MCAIRIAEDFQTNLAKRRVTNLDDKRADPLPLPVALSKVESISLRNRCRPQSGISPCAIGISLQLRFPTPVGRCMQSRTEDLISCARMGKVIVELPIGG